MTYSVNITATNQVVNVTNTSTNVVVSSAGTIIFTVTTTSTNVTVNSTSTIVTANYNAVEFRLNNLNTFWKDVWAAGYYTIGDLVNYNDSVFLLKQFSSDLNATYNSLIIPPNDTTYWQRIVWHEAPFDHVTVTNALLVGGNVTFNSNLTVANTASITQDAVISRDLSVGRNAIITGGLSVGAITGSSGITVSGPLRAQGTSTFVGTATFESSVIMPSADLTVRNISSTQRVTANNLVVSTTATLNGLTNINGLSNFNALASFNNGINANVITATNITVTAGLKTPRITFSDDTYIDGAYTTRVKWDQIYTTDGTFGPQAIYLGVDAGWGDGPAPVPRGWNIGLGYNSGRYNQASESISIGHYAGFQDQGGGYYGFGGAIAIGDEAGLSYQQARTIAIGGFAGCYDQQDSSVAIGNFAGRRKQGTRSVAIGPYAGYGRALDEVPYGYSAYNQGDYSIAIGHFKPDTYNYAFRSAKINTCSIVLNAQGIDSNNDEIFIQSLTPGLFIAPIRDQSVTTSTVVPQMMYYNTSTKEITYSANLTSSFNFGGILNKVQTTTVNDLLLQVTVIDYNNQTLAVDYGPIIF